MAILQRVAFYPNERFDIPDARALEAFSQNDWRFFLTGVWSNQSYILSGFEITNYSNIFSVPGIKIQLNDVVAIHTEATTQANGFYVSTGTEADAVLNLSPNATNFIEADFIVSTGTPDTRAFWDTGADAGDGAEFTDTVDTVINLGLTVSSNVSSFTTGKIKLYKITTNSSGVATSVQDCRDLFWRLGSGGSSPDPDSDFSWSNTPDVAHAQFETPITATSATTANAPFQGGDKNLKTFKDWLDVAMSKYKATFNLPYWYMDPGASATQMYQNSSMTLCVGGTWEHLSGTPGHLKLTGGSAVYRLGNTNDALAPFNNLNMTVNKCLYVILNQDGNAVTFGMGQDVSTPIVPKAVSAVTPTSVTVAKAGNYIASNGRFMVRGQIFSYTGYSEPVGGTTGIFTAVTPDPSQLVKVNDTVYQAHKNTIGYYHVSPAADAPGITANGVSEGVENCYWLAVFDGTTSIITRNSELVPGESVAVGDTTSAQIIQYIGSTGEADGSPVYGVSSIPDGTDLTQAIKAAFQIIEKPIFDEYTEYVSGLPINTDIILPLNSRNSFNPTTYTISSGELQIFLDGIMWRLNKDYSEISNNTIRNLKPIQSGSSLHFRIASIGGAGAAAGGSSGTSLQTAYANGSSITATAGSPVIIDGTAGTDVLWVKQNLRVDGVIDPKGIAFIPQNSNPFQPGQTGFWVKDYGATSNFVFTDENGVTLDAGQIITQVGGNAQYFARNYTNNSGATIPAGSPVYITSPGHVDLASAADSVRSVFFGIAQNAIPNGTSGPVIYQGVVSGIFTGLGFSSGYIWLSSTQGGLQLSQPTSAGNYLVIVGLIDGNDLILQPQWNGSLN